MKTITIPERFGYPTLDITINGKEETFASGVEIEVDDSVAEAIENAIALEPKQGRNLSRFAQFIEGSITALTANDLEGVENIAYYAFVNSKSLERIELPSHIKSVGYNAFAGCINLKTVVFAENSRLEKMGEYAFSGCSVLESIKMPEAPPTLVDINAFRNLNATCVFYCKTQASLNAYKAAENWSTLTGTYTFKVEE